MQDELNQIDNLIALQRWKMALEVTIKGLSREPENSELHLRMSIALSASDDPVAAENAAREAIRLSPDDGRMYNTLATALRQQGRYAEAEEAINEAHRLEPERAYFFVRHVHISLALKQNEKALAHALEAVRLDPTTARHHELAADCYNLFNQPEKVIEHCVEALRLDPEDIDVQRLYGMTLQKLGRHREAVPPLLWAMRKNPNDSSVHDALIDSMRSRNRLLRWLPLRSLFTKSMIEAEWITWVYMALFLIIPFLILIVLSFFPEDVHRPYIFLIPTSLAAGGVLLFIRTMVRFSLVAVLQLDREARPLLRVPDRLAGNGAIAIFAVLPLSVYLFSQHGAKVGMGMVAALVTGAFVLCLLFALRPGRSRRKLAALMPFMLAGLIWSAWFEYHKLSSFDMQDVYVALPLCCLIGCLAGGVIHQDDWK